jgi:hypothetical protein
VKSVRDFLGVPLVIELKQAMFVPARSGSEGRLDLSIPVTTN